MSTYQEEWAILQNEFYQELRMWTLVIDTRPRSRMGQCRFDAQEIGLSKWLIDLNGAAHPEVIDTLRHEVAHVLAGPEHDHDKVWKSYAVLVGAKPERTFKNSTAKDKVLFPERTHYWVAHCGVCDQGFSSWGKPRNTKVCPCYRKREAEIGRVEAQAETRLTFRRTRLPKG